MNSRPTIIERAFELAKSGECENTTAIRARLEGEGYSDVRSQIDGPILTKQLRDLCAIAKKQCPTAS